MHGLEGSFSFSLYLRAHFNIKVFASIPTLLALKEEENQFQPDFPVMEDVPLEKMPVQIFKTYYFPNALCKFLLLK